MNRARKKYSTAELQFVERHSAMKRADLHAAFTHKFRRRDVSVSNIRQLCTRRGWTTRMAWTAREDRLLRARYPDTSTLKLAKSLKRSLSSTYQRARHLNLRKSCAYLASPAACRLRRGDNVGAAYRFGPGHVPANKGVRRPGWAPGRMRSTQFRKGQNGWNWQPIGSERLIDGYRYTKVSDQRYVPYTVNWKPTNLLRWEAANGPLPKGHVLKSLDGDRLNVEAANWIAIPRGVLVRLAGRSGRDYDNAPEELKPTILAMAKLEHAAYQAARRRS